MTLNKGPVEEFVFEDWLRDGIRGMKHKLENRMQQARGRRSFMPAEFRKHMLNARKEQLLAVRSLIDNAIDRLDKKEENTQQKA